MRIAHIITRLIIGGAQENTILTCEGLTDRGHEVHLIAGPETGPEGSLWERARGRGYALHELPLLVRAVRPVTDLRCLAALTRLLRVLRPDVVHTHSSKAGIIGRMAARRAGVPHVVHTIHGMSFNRTQPRPVRMSYRALERYCGRLTERFVCVADAMTEQAVAAGLGPRERFITIYSGMEVDDFSPGRHERAAVRREWGFGDDAIVCGTVARLFAGKGYGQLLAVMPACVRAEPRLRFVWVGDGSARGRYVAALERAGLRDRVRLTGLVGPGEVARLLAGMDLLVHCSQWEGLPRVLVQALLMQVPVVSFDNDGAPEVNLPGRTGELVPLNDLDALREAIVLLARDPSRRERYGREGRARVLGPFDHREMVRQLEALYVSISGAGGAESPA